MMNYQCTHNILDTLMVVTFNVHRDDIYKKKSILSVSLSSFYEQLKENFK